MILITRGAECLLARQPAFPPGMYSTLAGFVEPGESLEETVVREAREEAGLEVEPLGYLGSQAWPFPASLMVGFRARSESRELTVDYEELEDARWVSREELRAPQGFFIPPPFSLANRLISAFLAEG
jgi:NAD+ diphosphatase